MYTKAVIDITADPATQQIHIDIQGHGVIAFRLHSPDGQPLTHNQILDYAGNLFRDIAHTCDISRTDNRYQAIEDLMRRTDVGRGREV